jgi:hypothetical protein
VLATLPNAAELYRRQIALGLDGAHSQVTLKGSMGAACPCRPRARLAAIIPHRIFFSNTGFGKKLPFRVGIYDAGVDGVATDAGGRQLELPGRKK